MKFFQGALFLLKSEKNNILNQNIWDYLPCGFGFEAGRGDCLTGALPFIPWAASLCTFCSTSLVVTLAVQDLVNIKDFGQMLLPEKQTVTKNQVRTQIKYVRSNDYKYIYLVLTFLYREKQSTCLPFEVYLILKTCFAFHWNLLCCLNLEELDIKKDLHHA